METIKTLLIACVPAIEEHKMLVLRHLKETYSFQISAYPFLPFQNPDQRKQRLER